ncbi:MICOS complex subunit MIC25 isoform X4 [Elephas maximus indicus]|uniref:MICOS complex subunit MIC25 isoform X4 n=1 Tax=Elephas maximus indicus TaxID=99487 RepID=UPI0021167461|nr:MICOS complex subunit MIC25 isoform X4 [Elephas maximus indicus]
MESLAEFILALSGPLAFFSQIEISRPSSLSLAFTLPPNSPLSCWLTDTMPSFSFAQSLTGCLSAAVGEGEGMQASFILLCGHEHLSVSLLAAMGAECYGTHLPSPAGSWAACRSSGVAALPHGGREGRDRRSSPCWENIALKKTMYKFQARELESIEAELRRRDTFYKEQLGRIERKNAEMYKLSSEQFHEAALKMESTIKGKEQPSFLA